LRLLPILIQAAGGRPEQNMSNSVKTVAGTLWVHQFRYMLSYQHQYKRRVPSTSSREVTEDGDTGEETAV
jgi:hypothetical protein